MKSKKPETLVFRGRLQIRLRTTILNLGIRQRNRIPFYRRCQLGSVRISYIVPVGDWRRRGMNRGKTLSKQRPGRGLGVVSPQGLRLGFTLHHHLSHQRHPRWSEGLSDKVDISVPNRSEDPPI